MVGVGQLALPVLGGRQFGAVPADDVGEHVGGFPPVRGLLALRFGGQAFADLVHPLGPGQFRRRPWPGLRVGLGWRGRHHPRVVRVGAPGHRRVQPLAVLVAGDHGDPGLALPALGGVRGAGVGGVEVLERGVADLAAEHRLPGPRVTAGGLADPHPPVVLDRLDPHHVAVGQPGLVVVDPVDDQVTPPARAPSASATVRPRSTTPRRVSSSRTRRASSRTCSWARAIKTTSVLPASNVTAICAAPSRTSSGLPPITRPCWSYSSATDVSPARSRKVASRSQGWSNRTGSASCR